MKMCETDMGNMRFRFDPPLEINVADNGNHWRLTNAEFDIQISGRTRRAVFDMLTDEMSALWNEIALEKDENLTADARALKQRLLKRMRKLNSETEA